MGGKPGGISHHTSVMGVMLNSWGGCDKSWTPTGTSGNQACLTSEKGRNTCESLTGLQTGQNFPNGCFLRSHTTAYIFGLSSPSSTSKDAKVDSVAVYKINYPSGPDYKPSIWSKMFAQQTRM